MKKYLFFFVIVSLLFSSPAWAMKRYYITPVVVGVDIDNNPENKAKINEFPGNKVCDIPTDPVTGLATSDWAICLFAGTPEQHSAVLAEATIIPVPNNENPDQALNPVPQSFRTYMGTKQVSINSSDCVREIVTKSGLKHNNNFNFERFFASE